MNHLVLTIRWLDDRYHGLLDRDGPPEWPPSPYRLFQSLVSGTARTGKLDSELGESLGWLQTLEPPMIVAPRSRPGQVITRFVPNNDGDKKPDRQDRLKGKTFRPTLMLGPPEIHYLWPIDAQSRSNAELVWKAASYLTCLGWGIDMAYARGRVIDESDIKNLSGVRWYPRKDAAQDTGRLRVPVFDGETNRNTLVDLKRAHQSALDRIEHGKPLNPVEKPRVFDHVFYESKDRLIPRPHVVFELRNDDGSFFRYPQDRLIHIAGMVRHMAINAMIKSPPERVPHDWVEIYVAGHRRGSARDTVTKNKCVDDAANDAQRDELRAGDEHRQLSYLPLPSIGHAHTDPSIRRVMIVAPLGDDRLLEHLARRLAGEQLEPTRQTKLEHPPTLVRVRNDNVASFYTTPANHWASVTPVILPGHDDHKPDKTRKLIEKALQQCGIDQSCEFEWGAFSHFTKSLSAHKYDRQKRPTGYIRPDHLLNHTAVHLKLRFNDGLKVPGPLSIGSGRHCGLGLMAGIDS